jgi:hypothetical protein
MGKILQLEKKVDNLTQIVCGVYAKHDGIVNDVIDCLGNIFSNNNDIE